MYLTLNCWLKSHGMVTPRPDKPDKIIPDRARPKNGWFYISGFLHKKFAGNVREVGQIARFC